MTHAEATETEERGAPITILLLQRDPHLQRLLAGALSSERPQLHFASAADEALEVIQRGDHLDLIILDLEMPLLDGRMFVRRLRRIGCNVPIIILATHGAGSARRELQAKAAVSKSADPEVFVDRVRSAVREHALRAAP